MENMLLCSQTSQTKSKKRKRNTTDDQYAIYISEMEKDYAFRSGTINPRMDDNYLTNKWKELSEKLNSVGNGVQLTPDEWKKRFKDWKNSTRAKYRKLCEQRMKTGGGPCPETKLTILEEKGLGVWGKVTVTGCNVYETGGLPEPTLESTAILTIEQPESCPIQVREADDEYCDLGQLYLPSSSGCLQHENLETVLESNETPRRKKKDYQKKGIYSQTKTAEYSGRKFIKILRVKCNSKSKSSRCSE